MGLAGIAVAVVALAGIQFARVIAETVTMSNHLATVRSQIVSLRQRESEQRAQIRRLQDPQGAIPEIHDRLRLVRADEAIVFVSPAPSTTP
jgi:cell division protein FtsB